MICENYSWKVACPFDLKEAMESAPFSDFSGLEWVGENPQCPVMAGCIASVLPELRFAAQCSTPFSIKLFATHSQPTELTGQ